MSQRFASLKKSLLRLQEPGDSVGHFFVHGAPGILAGIFLLEDFGVKPPAHDCTPCKCKAETNCARPRVITFFECQRCSVCSSSEKMN